MEEIRLCRNESKKCTVYTVNFDGRYGETVNTLIPYSRRKVPMEEEMQLNEQLLSKRCNLLSLKRISNTYVLNADYTNLL